MAGSSILSRLSSSRLPSLSLKLRTNKSIIPPSSPLKASSQPQVSSSVKRISSRLPVELSCLISMMPLHTTIASARLKSLLSVDSQSWGLVPQGISMPL
ncbi:protein NUCLEAR FUSION DEFECTIVE 6, chloroplastic/mitochondrial [Melia azedarach]|uniref:Protein NUCLEAR FUSION DEFECTIVE 6, chloroplastic/mitochondrial n=1 Tax=Melia azedarach TaxID=155640 RepID=A0ACC1XBC2_MELAZ|nr:protein NUCLEAR FUSION DEFECTIVE 6, chloroplastic/mitochondrial [Melia azedarach]